MQISVDWQAVKHLWDVLFPFVGMVIGFWIGSRILRLFQQSLGGDDRWSRSEPSDEAKAAVEWVSQPHPPAPKKPTGACRYCGQQLTGNKCGNCGAPQE